MPHQEPLPRAWLAALIGAFLFLLLAASPAVALAQQTAPELHVEAVRGTGWDDTTPPADGWTPVTLPDSWAGRWPGFDGVVWYRLTWEQPEQVR